MNRKVKCSIPGCLSRPIRGSVRDELRFCKEHNEQYDVKWVKCDGEAHQPGMGAYYDHCYVCMPHWGKYPIPVKKEGV